MLVLALFLKCIKNYACMAGLLLTSLLNTFTLVQKIKNIKVLFKPLLSLRQWGYCRFSMHSLLIAFRKTRVIEPMCIQKYSFQIKNNNPQSLKHLCLFSPIKNVFMF